VVTGSKGVAHRLGGLADELPDDFLAAFQNALVRWYKGQQRDLPWRRTRDPYAIWVSEIMLQQTRVDQVMPYFLRFLEAFPTVHALASASLGQVLKVWEGLGYYARARNMHAAARQIVNEHGGRVPDSMKTISALPGIGPYTAPAILSIAYDQDYAVVDGNVVRVLCRVFMIDQDPREGSIKHRLRQLAERLLPRGKASVFNQALMELGALACTPKTPSCESCPLRTLCKARTLGDPSSLPRRPAGTPKPHYQVTAGIIWKGDEILIAQRNPKGLLGSMWEFPGGKQEAGESLEQCLRREVKEELDVEISIEHHLTTVRHTYTHFRITLHAFQCVYVTGEPKALGCADWRWVGVEELGGYPFARADQRILAAVLGAR